jgi:VanZ family protein
VILFATSVPSSVMPRRLSLYDDKVVHFSMYGVLAALLARYVLSGAVAVRAAIVTVACVTAFGAADEWHQRFIPGRSTEFADWVADSAGALVGAAAMIAYAVRKTAPSRVQ